MNDESKFLHELSTSLSTLLLLVDSMKSDAKKRVSPNSHQVTDLESTMTLLNRMQTLMDERKQLIRRDSR
jgi:hypothetical protein